MALEFLRFVYIYIILFGIFLFFLSLAYRVLRRGRKQKLNQILANFYIFNSIAILVNMIYAQISDPQWEPLVVFLNKVSIYLVSLSLFFLLFFILNIKYPTIRWIIMRKYRILLLLAYAGYLGILFFIPDGVTLEILSDGTQTFPVWGLSFSIFLFLTHLALMIPILYLTALTFQRFKNVILRKRLRNFFIGLCVFFYFILMLPISNHLNVLFIRRIYTFSSIFLILGGYLIYYGIGTPLTNPVHCQ